MDTLKTIAEQLAALDDYAVIGHSIPDGDSIGSILALYLGLNSIGKKVKVIMQDALSSIYDYLPAVDEFLALDDIEVMPENLIFLDCSRLERIGDKAENKLYDRKLTINIDHHQDNDLFGDYNYVNPQASSTAEIIYELLNIMKIEINSNLADCLYAGIVMDTGSFMNSNTSSTTMRIASMLLDKGADINKARNNLLESKPYKEVLLLRQGLKNLKFYKNGRIACMKLPYDEVRGIEALEIHPEGIINYARSIKGVDVAVLLREVTPGLIKIGYRSKNNDIDVAALANKLGGGGHKLAAGARQQGDLDEVTGLVIEMIEDVLD